MAKDPAFLFYPNDWLGGTMGMSFELQGAYLSLLILQFNRGPFNDLQAVNVVGIDRWSNLISKFHSENGFYFNTRLKNEQEKRGKFSQHQRNNVNKRYQNSTKPLTENLPLEDRNENRNEDKSLIEIKIEEFYNFRKKLKKPIIEESKEAFLKKLNKISGGIESVAIEILDESISNGWQGIFELKNNNYGTGKTNNDNRAASRHTVGTLAGKVLAGNNLQDNIGSTKS